MNWVDININIAEHQEQLDRLINKKQKLDMLRPLPSAALSRIKETLNLEWTYNSNAIEGNTLSLNETKMILENGITVKGKSLREHFEVVNHTEAIEFIESLAKPGYQFNEKDLLQVHYLVLNKIEKEFAGRYRNSGVRIVGANFTPPNALKVTDYISNLFNWINFESQHLNPIVKACIFHHRMVWVHPFFDGNGRTTRLLYNLLLLNEGFVPAIILKSDRKKYYDALNKANQSDYNKLLLLVMQALERTLDIYLSNFNNYAEDYQPISSIVEEDSVPYGQEYVSLLARTGKIDAYKEGNVWFTTEDAVVSYINKRKRKR